MFHTEKSIIITTNYHEVIKILINVSNYHLIFPFYEKAKSQDDNKWKMTVHLFMGIFTNTKIGKRHSWISEITYSLENNTIYTDELEPIFPVMKLQSLWTVIPYKNHCKVILSHKFDVSNPKYLFYWIVKIAISVNSHKLLKQLKKYIER